MVIIDQMTLKRYINRLKSAAYVKPLSRGACMLK